MALFSRRRLSVSLHRNAAIVSQEKLKDWVARLNTISDDYVATEWELILLEAFTQLGSLRYEPEELGRVDLDFESADGRVLFAADIIAVSDRQLHKENPAAFLADEFRRKLRKAEIIHGTFFYKILEKDHSQGWGRGHERVLLLPHVSAFPTTIFNENWLTFITAIRANPASKHEFHAFQPDETDVRLSYMPCSGRLNFCGSHGSYTSANVLTDNPLFNSLQRKAKKLKRINPRGMRGIIVCDGGCELLTIPPSWESYSIREITAELFRQFKSIDFVLTIGIKGSPSLPFTSFSSYQYVPQLFPNPRLNDLPHFRAILSSMLKQLPPPQMSPGNVINEVKWDRPKLSPSFYTGGWRWSDNSTRMSSRELLAVLSGGLPQDQFLENHRLANGGHGFLTRFASGREITGIALEPRPDEDDDFLTIYFGSADRCETSVCDASREPEILVPSQQLLYFLAGIINQGEFLSYVNPSDGFEKGVSTGRTIQGACYRHDGNRGWIHLKFGDRDPAVSPFWVQGSGSR